MWDLLKGNRSLIIRGLVMSGVLLGLVGAAWFARPRLHPFTVLTSHGEEEQFTNEDSDHEDVPLVRLMAIHPHLNNQELVHTLTQPVFVQPYYRADLMARVAGTVKAVHKNIGEIIKKGELLIELDVPDLEQSLAQKEALVTLAEEEVRASQASLLAVRAASKEAVALLDEKGADLDRARSKRKYQEAVYRRIRKLAESSAVETALVDERLSNLDAAIADVKSSQAAVDTGRANVEELSARVKQAEIDINVKQAKVAVARAERDLARAILEYAHIRAPFDGMVVSRRIDPGAFVQNASTGRGEPLLSVVRTDKVTLVLWAPEREATLVRPGASATVLLDAFRGKAFTTKVSRVSNWLDPEKARDMRVEADIENPSDQLRVGMYGTMRVVLQRFDKAWLLPSTAVFVRHGQAMICEVIDGVTKFHRVRIQYEDGVSVKVVKLVSRQDSPTSLDVDQEVELTGDETIVKSGQGELRDGQEIQVTMTDW